MAIHLEEFQELVDDLPGGAQEACRMALVRPITDDPDMRDALDATVTTYF